MSLFRGGGSGSGSVRSFGGRLNFLVLMFLLFLVVLNFVF